jgi:hypothetical protein
LQIYTLSEAKELSKNEALSAMKKRYDVYLVQKEIVSQVKTIFGPDTYNYM